MPVGNYECRLNRIYDWMAGENIALAMLEDFEGRRDPGIRYFTGQPGDSLLFLSAERKSLLVPWDINMALAYAHADARVPFAEFDRSPYTALQRAAEFFKTPLGAKLEIPPATAYPRFLRFVEALTDFDILCREDGIAAEIKRLRAVKDEDEIKIYRQLSALTNGIIDGIEERVRAGKIRTETEAALFIETEGRRLGCEGTGFETLAAGPERSFGIHAFPAYTGGPFGGQGLSILDFGLNCSGYTSDVTMTFARGPLNKIQERMLALVERAYNMALSMVKKDCPARQPALELDRFFGKAKKTMPHALGHGIGLEAHEAPLLTNRADNTWTFRPGMIVTLEPGLYDPVHGGCRLENDILVTETGPELLTNSRIVRF
jgi:Xaa-Pro dipeptidase